MSPLVARLEQLLPAAPFGRGVALLAGGTIVAQAVSLLVSPIITRLYDPVAFGIFGLYSSLVSIVLPLASLRFEMAIPLPREDERAAALFRLSMLVLVATTLILTAVTIAGADMVARWLHAPAFARYAWAIPLGFAAAGGYQILSFWAIRHTAYRTLTRTKVTQGLAQVATQLGVGLITSSPLGLLLGDIAGRGAGIARLFREFRGSVTERGRAHHLHEASRYRRFALLTAPASMLNAVAPQLPALLLVRLYGPAVGGLFALGQRLLGAPILLIGQSIGQVFQAEGARLVRENPDELKPLFNRTAWRLVRLGALPIFVGAVVAPWVMPVLFGRRWSDAGPLVQSLALAYMAEIVVSPLSSAAAITENQHLELAVSVVRVILVGGTFWMIGVLALEPLAAIRVYAVTMLVTYGFFFLMYRHTVALHAVQSRPRRAAA